MEPFLNWWMLAGLGAVAIPPIIHLLNRQRFEVVEWGAMQFLQVSETTRRRLLIEEILLMLLRMFLIALMVIVLAGPFITSNLFAKMGSRPNRDVVLIIDGSYSMGYTGGGPSTQDAAKEWATAFVNDLSAGDTVAILQAKQQVIPIIGTPTHELERARVAIKDLPPPSGGCDWPRAVEAAREILIKNSQRPQRDIIIISDNQKYSWADDTTMLGWGLLANQLRDEKTAVQPKVWVVNVAPNRPKDPPNWSLAPLKSTRAVVGKDREVMFRTALDLHGQDKYSPPYRLRLEIDGQPVRDLPAPNSAPLEKGQVPLSFTHRFKTHGSHLVSVIVEPDPPPDQRPAGYAIKDQLPGDNRQDYALEVVNALPVLLVDGDSRPPTGGTGKPYDRGTDFALHALAPKLDPTPVVLARVVPIQDFEPKLLTANLGKEPGTKARVLILSNVPRLTPRQNDAINKFLAEGGGVLVTLGHRVDAKFYNEQLYQGGKGWLPAQLEDTSGDESDLSKAATPMSSSFFHPALDLFREVQLGGLGDARFPRWWKMTMPGRGSPAMSIAMMSSNDPLFVERPFQAGRVVVCAVPLDNSWRTNVTRLPAFPPLMHELVYYLAGARASRHNLQPGQVLRFQPADETPAGSLEIHPPQGEVKKLAADHWPFDYRETRETGVYRVEEGSHVSWYVVQPDPRESQLAPCEEEDREKVKNLVPLTYENDREKLALAMVESSRREELWLWFLLGVIGLLLGEVLMTRYIAMKRA